MVTLSETGAHWIGERIGYASNGAAGALLALFADWLFPRGLKTIYIQFDLLYRAYRVDNALASSGASKARRGLTICAWMALALGFGVLVPGARLIVAYHGVTGYAGGFALTTLTYLQTDGPPGQERMARIASRDAAAVYGALAFALTHRPLMWSLAKWTFFRLTLPALCLVAALYVLRAWLPLTRVRDWVLFDVVAKIPAVWDQLDIWEAQLMERLPHYLQDRWSSYQQNRPQRRNTPLYKYQPLKEGEIRLLVLKRSRWFPSVLRAHLVHAPLDAAPAYEALSYRWGSVARTNEILVDGARFPVTRSAFDLLLARRSVWRNRTLWVDALCIDQDAAAEKSAQVQLMRTIYQNADRVVLVPRGPDWWRARAAAPLLYELAAAAYQFEGTPREFHDLYAGERQSPRWRAMVALFADDYFARAWVIQEIAVGRRVELYFGGLYIPWAVFLEVVGLCMDPQRRNMLMMGDTREAKTFVRGDTFENIALMGILRAGDSGAADLPGAGGLGLGALLFSASKFGATDPRDRVFALLGLARSGDNDDGDDGAQQLIRPDYERPVEHVFRNAMEVALTGPQEHRCVQLLALAGTGFSAQRMADLPSWVPDLSEERLCFPYADGFGHPGCYNASGNRTATVVLDGDYDGSVSLGGVVIDRILELSTGAALDFGVEAGAQFEVLRLGRVKYHFVQAAMELCRKHAGSADAAAEMLEQRLWRALVAGRVERQPAGPRFGAVFQSWLLLITTMAEARDFADFEQHVRREGLLDLPEWAAINDGSSTSYDVSTVDGAYGRRFAVSAAGRLCLLPPLTEAGDLICIPFGAQTPFVIRQRDTTAGKGGDELVGEAFVEGVMYGEAMGIGEEEMIRLA
ncbi:Uu.00g016860.m01.CDS01 [Anthostomella pinea]|uniref:Uu.00g016860.m01.CDS01 n=1 Tax=Anthostomella pinea TaxID=933095 RepID=A0AAI8VYT6_9PEZI|nr:Uu.00g016860.m01.CDS01 [Anthostomella pinea]